MSLKSIAKKVLKKNNSVFTLYSQLDYQRKHAQNISGIPNQFHKIISEIQKNSFCIIPNFFDEKFCNECKIEIDSLLQKYPEYVQKESDLRIFGAEVLSKTIKDFSDNDFLTRFANYYNGSKTFNAFTLANYIEFEDKSKKLGSGGGWHRDSFFRQCKVILYLNDVDSKNGAYQILKNSHKLFSIIKDSKSANLKTKQTRFSEEQIQKIIEKDPERLVTVTGKKGTLILKDCSAIHRGSPLQEGERYALTNYYAPQTSLDQNLIDRFSPIVSPEKILKLAKNNN